MQHAPKRTLASLLVLAVLATPSAALASSGPTVAETMPAPTMPAPAQPSEGKGGESLVTPKLTREEAIAIAKQYFTIPADLGEPNVGIQQTKEMATWSLEWRSSSKAAEQTRISVTVDAVTGVIYGYTSWTSQPEESLQLSITRDEAKSMAMEFFNKMVPAEHQASLRLVDSPLNAGYWGGTTYTFQWQRDVKGYPLSGNGVHISVDAGSGEILNYNLNWRPAAAFTLPSTMLSRADAETAYGKNTPMVLQYQRFTKRGTDESEWRLVYRPLTGEFPRMNQEGVLLDWNGEPLDMEAYGKTEVVPASDKPYSKPAKPLEQAEALALAQAISGRMEQPNHSSYSEYGDEVKRSAWDFSWTTAGTEEQTRSEMRVRIDAETGLVTEFSQWSEHKPFEKGEKAPVSLEQAREKAIAFLRTHRPDLAGNIEVRLNQPRYGREMADYQPTEYYIPFQLLKNGLPVNGREMQVTVNARTGEIRHFWSHWYDERPNETYPSPEGVLSADEALAVFFEQQGIEAAWSFFYNEKKGGETEPALVWQPTAKLPMQAIDARSGAPLDWEGRNLIEAQRYPSDIKGHAAEREIELLWARGVFDLEDGKFNPNQPVRADELAKWIILSRGLRPFVAYDFKMAARMGAGGAAEQAAASVNSAYFGAALQNGIILPEELATLQNVRGSVPRELFALWAARAMGYGRVAKMEAKIAMDFIDADQIDAKYQNAVALLSGLGVVSPDFNNRFNPKLSLTRAEAAKILFAVSSERRY